MSWGGCFDVSKGRKERRFGDECLPVTLFLLNSQNPGSPLTLAHTLVGSIEAAG